MSREKNFSGIKKLRGGNCWMLSLGIFRWISNVKIHRCVEPVGPDRTKGGSLNTERNEAPACLLAWSPTLSSLSRIIHRLCRLFCLFSFFLFSFFRTSSNLGYPDEKPHHHRDEPLAASLMMGLHYHIVCRTKSGQGVKFNESLTPRRKILSRRPITV